MNRLKFFLTSEPWMDAFGVYLRLDEGDGKRSRATNITFQTMTESDYVANPEALLMISYEDAQHLMDELFRVGVRPSDQGSPGQLAAVKYHLEDMRRLVFEGKK